MFYECDSCMCGDFNNINKGSNTDIGLYRNKWIVNEKRHIDNTHL